jgi:hypothetical protein
MSILVVQLAPAGLLFGADRNITHTITYSFPGASRTISGQAQRPKVLKSPNHELIVGYVGQAQLDGRPTDEWLYAFIGSHLRFATLHEVAYALTADLNTLISTIPGQALILHLGGFEQVGEQPTPRVYFIRNTTALTPQGEYVVGTTFDCSEELADPRSFGAKTADQIRAEIAWPNYFSFRQGALLNLFNTIDEALRAAVMALVATGLRNRPTTLDELADHGRFQIHGYGAYFAAFYPPSSNASAAVSTLCTQLGRERSKRLMMNNELFRCWFRRESPSVALPPVPPGASLSVGILRGSVHDAIYSHERD